MKDLIKEVVREMILNGEIAIAIIEDEDVWSNGYLGLEIDLEKQSIYDSVEIKDLMRLVWNYIKQ